MLMSGRTLWRLPIAPDAKRLCPPRLENNTLAAVFNRAGYATMRACKIGNSYEGANQQFAVRKDATKRGGSEAEGSVWHGRQMFDYLAEREAKQDARPFLIYFGFSHDTRDGLAGDPRYAEKLAEMEALLLAEMRRLDNPYRLWNQPADDLPPPADAKPNKPQSKVRRSSR